MLTRSHIDAVVRAALDEDAPWGDLTSETLIPADATATAGSGPVRAASSPVARFAAASALTDPVSTPRFWSRTERFARGDALATVSGRRAASSRPSGSG
jgi:nicotinate-nucleotide pyrophosphorylase (carboxylating)